MTINRLKHKTIEIILKERKNGFFQSLKNFFLRVKLDFSDAMILTESGCFYALEPNMSHREIAFHVAIFCMNTDNANTSSTLLPNIKSKLPLSEILKLENESFGFPVTRHPLDIYSSILKNKVRNAIDISKFKNKTINLAGVLITKKITGTKKHEPMEFVTFEDKSAIFECVMFPKVYQEFGDLLNWEKLFVIRGKVEEAWNTYTITIEKLWSLSKIGRNS